MRTSENRTTEISKSQGLDVHLNFPQHTRPSVCLRLSEWPTWLIWTLVAFCAKIQIHIFWHSFSLTVICNNIFFSLTLGTVGTGINGSGIVGGGGGIFTDEHSLIAQYCQKLHNGDLISAVPDSPLTLMAEIDAEQRHELELMIRELETENATLQVRTIYTFEP